MCDVLSKLESSGVSRRNILASFGLGAAAVTLTAGADNSPGKSSVSQSFGPAPAEGHRTRLVPNPQPHQVGQRCRCLGPRSDRQDMAAIALFRASD